MIKIQNNENHSATWTQLAKGDHFAQKIIYLFTTIFRFVFEIFDSFKHCKKIQ